MRENPRGAEKTPASSPVVSRLTWWVPAPLQRHKGPQVGTRGFSSIADILRVSILAARTAEDLHATPQPGKGTTIRVEE